MGPLGAPSKWRQRRKAHRFKQALPLWRRFHTLVVTLLMQFLQSTTDEQWQKVSMCGHKKKTGAQGWGPPLGRGVSSKPTFSSQKILLATETSTGIGTAQLLQTSRPRKEGKALIFWGLPPWKDKSVVLTIQHWLKTFFFLQTHHASYMKVVSLEKWTTLSTI